ncbi:MAG: DUF1844 domain-containing protein [Acidobacteriota bacterium]
MSDEKSIKVKDRRMFTPTGELREEYRDLSEASPPDPSARRPDAESAGDAPAAQPIDPSAGEPPAGRRAPMGGPPPAGAQAAGTQGAAAPGAPTQAAGSPAAGPPSDEEEVPKAAFRDLVGLLAQSTLVYLQQAAQLDIGRRAEAVELARLHIDLLVVLKQKTAGNLDAAEQAMLDDALYRLRMAAVEHG